MYKWKVLVPEIGCATSSIIDTSFIELMLPLFRFSVLSEKCADDKGVVMAVGRHKSKNCLYLIKEERLLKLW